MAEVDSRQGRKTADPPSEMRFFEGLAWPVPLAFADALSAMRFEQGDVIYRDPRAYEALEGKLPEGLSAIQVLLPPRGARAMGSEADGNRRAASWQSEATVALIDLARGTSETRVVSQGRLAMAIFSGDDTWLDPEREAPPLLRSARELQAHLERTRASFDARQKTKRGCRFLFVVDLASDASRRKAAGVEEALATTGPVERIDLSAEEAGIEDADTYHPTAIVRGLVLRGRSPDDVLPLLRTQLYGGGAPDAAADEAAEGGSEAAPDRFSIARHGILEAIPSEPG